VNNYLVDHFFEGKVDHFFGIRFRKKRLSDISDRLL